MKTFELLNGDLVPGPGGHRTIDGADRIRQDLWLFLSEPYGDDRFHRNHGSTLINYIGLLANPETQLMVQTEMYRVIRTYITAQQDLINKSISADQRSRYKTKDIIANVRDVITKINYDTIEVSATLTTRSGEEILVGKEVAA